MVDNFESIWSYCIEKERAIPKDWNKLYGLLKNKEQHPNGSWTPALPLILATWHHSTPIEKQLRFKEHVRWAVNNGQIEDVSTYLRSLKEEDWFHFEEL